jgi:hypothetical protein
MFKCSLGFNQKWHKRGSLSSHLYRNMYYKSG